MNREEYGKLHTDLRMVEVRERNIEKFEGGIKGQGSFYSQSTGLSDLTRYVTCFVLRS